MVVRPRGKLHKAQTRILKDLLMQAFSSKISSLFVSIVEPKDMVDLSVPNLLKVSFRDE